MKCAWCVCKNLRTRVSRKRYEYIIKIYNTTRRIYNQHNLEILVIYQRSSI